MAAGGRISPPAALGYTAQRHEETRRVIGKSAACGVQILLCPFLSPSAADWVLVLGDASRDLPAPGTEWRE
jgi:hypothetical protein